MEGLYDLLLEWVLIPLSHSPGAFNPPSVLILLLPATPKTIVTSDFLDDDDYISYSDDEIRAPCKCTSYSITSALQFDREKQGEKESPNPTLTMVDNSKKFEKSNVEMEDSKMWSQKPFQKALKSTFEESM